MQGQARSLRAQATRRMAWVGLVATLTLLAVGSVSFFLVQEKELDLRRQQVDEYYARVLPELEARWHADVAQLRARLEFTRFLEGDSPLRWAKVSAFLATQWGYSDFSDLLILDSSKQVVYRYGAESASLEPFATESGDWLYSPQYRQLYRVYRSPIWLGMQGQGEMVLYKWLSNSVLLDMAIPETRLILTYKGEFMAGSHDEAGKLLKALGDVSIPMPSPLIRLDRSWPSLETAERPTLIALRSTEGMVSWAGFAVRPIIASIMILAMFWFGLGRWLNGTTRRIGQLDASAQAYLRSGNQANLAVDLAEVRQFNDEIAQTADAMQELVTTLEARDLEQRAYAETLAMLEDAVIEVAMDGAIVRASPGWSKLTNSPGDAVGSNFFNALHHEDIEHVRGQLAPLHAGLEEALSIRLRLRQSGDEQEEPWAEGRFIAHAAVDGGVNTVRGVLRDITQTYLHEKQITHMALHDTLTGLPNRILLEDRIKISMRMAGRHGENVGVCFIDLDHFKLVNDSLGHKAGDLLLIEFSRRLRSVLRSGDTLARWGGDEFVLLLPEMKTEQAIREVAGKVVEALQAPLDIEGTEIRVTFSMGAAIYPLDGEDVEQLFSHADRAMFFAKEQGRNQFCFYRDVAESSDGKQDLYLQNKLAAAINEGRIQAWFQPIVSAHTGRCTSVEVLARWHDEELGWISPATFIPMAENLGLIGDLGQQVMVSSLDALRDWYAEGIAILLAVNVSKRQLFTRDFNEFLLRAVYERNLPPDSLILEVTESLAINDVDKGTDRIQELQQNGFSLAIDDFGTGYSSLSQLHEIKALELKIDISFVRRLHEPSGRSMVQAIINLANALGMKTVAEGVEDAETAAQLAEMGVHCLQGYLYAKPMARAEFEAWFVAQRQEAAG